VTNRDPREHYDELLEPESRKRLAPAAFEAATESEVATVGWLVPGFVFDDRVLLIEQP